MEYTDELNAEGQISCTDCWSARTLTAVVCLEAILTDQSSMIMQPKQAAEQQTLITLVTHNIVHVVISKLQNHIGICTMPS